MWLDPGFNPPSGLANVDPPGGGTVACFALAVRPDGRILAAGYETHDKGQHPLVLQLGADGTPDAFAMAGLHHPVVGTAVTRGPQGKVFVAGWSGREDTACFVLGLTP
jgi:hypothetical protein